jgi:hypothetical protein
MIKELMEKFEIKHGFSTPYHPKTNGLVERFNKTLCEALSKLGKDKREWDINIAPVLLAYRSKIQNTTKIEPFYLVYGRKPVLPIDEEHLIIDEEPERQILLTERIEDLVNKVPGERYQAKENTEKSQIKQKEYHDKKIKKKSNFEIGEKVLYFNAAKEKQWSGKLEEKWKGPYYIHQIIMNGSYKIKELCGKVLITPVNGELLKKYYSRESFESYVVI